MRNFCYAPKLFLASLFLCFIHIVQAQDMAAIPGDFPDPTVISADGRYYAIGTSSEWGPHFPIYESTDLQDWKQTGFVFTTPPEWTASSFWAPEYFYHNGLYYVYYSAKRKGDGVSCIGVATSRYPDRDFVDHGVVVDYGSESIDAYVVQDGEDLYMTWKAYGLDDRPIELLASKMSSDGFRLEGEPFSLLLDTAGVGIEGQSFVRKDGYYYMFYSAGSCCGVQCDYHVQAVRSRTIHGPYERIGDDMLLGENAGWRCMGHGTFVEGPAQRIYYLFHGYNKVGTTYTGREGLLAELTWTPGGRPQFLFTPSSQTTDRHDVQVDLTMVHDQDSIYWQWDYNAAVPHHAYTENGLALSGSKATPHSPGVVLTVRPHSIDYTVGATVDLEQSSKTAAKGIVVYGDANQSVGVDIKDDRIRFWSIRHGEKTFWKEEPAPLGQRYVELTLSIHPDRLFRASYKHGEDWVELHPASGAGIRSDGISPWDRSPRPGLYVDGSEDDQAVFSHFYVVNRP